MKKNKGFTLIELLVVIAIIGILASVVLASLNTARAKGANAAVKSNLNNVRAQAELVYDTAGGTYLGVCSDSNVLKAKTAANSASGGVSICNSTKDIWVLGSPLKTAEPSGAWWCVDNTGTSRATAEIAADAIICP